MTTLPTTTKSDDQDHISRGDLAYVCARNQAQAHGMLVRAVKGSGMSQKELAVRTGIDEATISRVLSRPRNVEINTLSKLLYGACGMMISFSLFTPQQARAERIYLANQVRGAEVRGKESTTDTMFYYENVTTLAGSTGDSGFGNLVWVGTNEGRVRQGGVNA